jgi:SEFIR domain
MPNLANPAVFISYTHDSEEHRQRVLELAQRLRADGADSMVDRFVNGSPPEGWPLWMERQIQRADFVLVVCTATYLRRYRGEEQPGKGLGGVWEAVLTRQELYENSARNTKFVPILFPGASQDDIPTPLRPYTWHRLPDGYVELVRYLTEQPAIVPAPLGQKKLLPPER